MEEMATIRVQNSTMIAQNGTNSSAEENFNSILFSLYFLAVTGFLAFLIFLLVVITLTKAIVSPIRFILWNILAASVLVIIGMEMFLVHSVVIPAFGTPRSEFVCHVTFTILAIASAARLVLMPLFASVVLVVVLYGISKLKLIPVIISVLIVWLLCILPNMAVLSPQVWNFQDIEFDLCAPIQVGGSSIAYTVLYLIVYGLSSIVLTIVITVFQVVYIRKNTSQDKRVFRRMMKFGILLLVGNGLSILGVSVPLVTSSFLPHGDDRTPLLAMFINYAEIGLFSCSVIPPPIVLLVIFEPVRTKTKHILCVCCCSCYKHWKQGRQAKNVSIELTLEHNVNTQCAVIEFS